LESWGKRKKTNRSGKKMYRVALVTGANGGIGSVTSLKLGMGNFGQTNYSALKAALIGFTKSLSKEVAPKGIRVNAIAPGFVDTEMTRKIAENIKNKILEQIPLRRFATPEEIVAVILFLCNASYITGTVIDVNGGMR
jgi:3-oxoacyl-[acyl-carrier protein] reductase